MFFTRQLLEQATDEQVADYKAQRWPAEERLVRPVLRHRRRPDGAGPPRACRGHRSRSGGRGLGTRRTAAWSDRRVRKCSWRMPASKTLPVYASWHIDPDRRIEGKRSTRVEFHEPDLDALEAVAGPNPKAALKLAPATKLPDSWLEAAELGVDRKSRRVPPANGLVSGAGSRSEQAFGDGLRGRPDRAQDYSRRRRRGDTHAEALDATSSSPMRPSWPLD